MSTKVQIRNYFIYVFLQNCSHETLQFSQKMTVNYTLCVGCLRRLDISWQNVELQHKTSHSDEGTAESEEAPYLTL